MCNRSPYSNIDENKINLKFKKEKEKKLTLSLISPASYLWNMYTRVINIVSDDTVFHRKLMEITPVPLTRDPMVM